MDKFSDSVAEDASQVLHRLTDMEDGTHAKRVEAYPPKKLMTDEDGA